MRYLKYTLLIAVFLISSCEEFIDRPPLDAIDNDSYWKTSGDLERYVLKYYTRLPSHGNGIYFSDVDSDDIMQDVVQPTLNGERPITTGNWINEWSDIRSLNIFFDNYTKVEDDIASYQHYLGEAHFFKAWFY